MIKFYKYSMLVSTLVCGLSTFTLANDIYRNKVDQAMGILDNPDQLFKESNSAEDVEAGPIWDNNDAQRKCPDVCKKRQKEWDKAWRTVTPGQMSVCHCVPSQRNR